MTISVISSICRRAVVFIIYFSFDFALLPIFNSFIQETSFSLGLFHTFVGGVVVKMAGALDSSLPRDRLMSSVGKMMVSVHFITIPR